jgi:hypothetical protein
MGQIRPNGLATLAQPRLNSACWLGSQAKWPGWPDRQRTTCARLRGHHGLDRCGGAGGEDPPTAPGQWDRQHEHKEIEGMVSGNANEARAHQDGATPVRGGGGKLGGAFRRRRRLLVDDDSSGMSYSLRMGRG